MSHGRGGIESSSGGFSDHHPPPAAPAPPRIPVFVVTKKAASPEGTLIAFTGVLEQRRHKVGLKSPGEPPEQGETWPPLLQEGCPDLPRDMPPDIRRDIRSPSSSSWSSCWVGRRNLNFFSLGGTEDWPSLDGGGKGKAISGGDLSLLGGNGCSTSCWPSCADADILSTKGPTQEQQQLQQRDDDEGGLLARKGCKGWMRLPPIVMPSQQPKPNSKRSRVDSEEEEEAEAAAAAAAAAAFALFQGNCGQGRDAGGAGSLSSSGEEAADLPPVNYLMLNKDFVVISPLKESLLLTLALTTKRRPSSPPPPFDRGQAEIVEEAGKRLRRHVFVGRFEAFSSYVRFGLGRDALRVATEANAGGTSTISESLSVEYFVRKFQAKDVVTEMEVEYCAMNWKKVDYICSLYDQRVGVSVTRAMSYPNPEEFTPQMAYRLLYKKLFGLVVARHGVTERHSFSQCILHVWCETTTTAKLLEAQYKEVSEELDIADDVIMVLTVAEGWHARPIFYESCLDRS